MRSDDEDEGAGWLIWLLLLEVAEIAEIFWSNGREGGVFGHACALVAGIGESMSERIV